VKSLGLAQQEVGRLNGITAKILKLELKKVKYLRSLSFIQGTAVNALRSGILFLMLYLIFRQEITIGNSSLCGFIRFTFSGLCRSWERHQCLSRNGSFAGELSADSRYSSRSEACRPEVGG